MKTEMQIERDFYAMVKASSLGQQIRGHVYRAGMRPYNSTDEDLVVKFLSGIDAQVQYGIVVMNLYVPDVQISEGRMVADSRRIAELQLLIREFIEEADTTEYLMQTDATPSTMFAEEIQQRVINIRIKFYILNQ